MLGLTYRQAKRNDEARQAFEKAAQLDARTISVPRSTNSSRWTCWTSILILHGRGYGVSSRRTPDVAVAHYFEGKILAAEGKWDPAGTELQRTVELDPNFVAAYDLLVQTYVATNRLPQAINQLQALLSKNPNNASSLMTLALIYEQINDYPKARDAYEKLLSINPDFVPALNNLAYLYTERLNDLNKAYDLARKAHDLQPQDAAVADTLGWVLYKRGDYQQALADSAGERRKTPRSPEVQFHLGMTAYMMGQTDLAKVAFQKAASAAKDFPGKEESKRRLALLESGTGCLPGIVDVATRGDGERAA